MDDPLGLEKRRNHVLCLDLPDSLYILVVTKARAVSKREYIRINTTSLLMSDVVMSSIGIQTG